MPLNGINPFDQFWFDCCPLRQGYENRSDFLGGYAATLTQLLIL